MSASPVDSQGRPSIWRWLTEPPVSIKEPEHRQKARLLSSLLVPLIPLALLVFVIRLLTDPTFTPSPVAMD
jgi:GAF domain-containing protein